MAAMVISALVVVLAYQQLRISMWRRMLVAHLRQDHDVLAAAEAALESTRRANLLTMYAFNSVLADLRAMGVQVDSDQVDLAAELAEIEATDYVADINWENPRP